MKKKMYQRESISNLSSRGKKKRISELEDRPLEIFQCEKQEGEIDRLSKTYRTSLRMPACT